jgi:hypothetical protein
MGKRLGILLYVLINVYSCSIPHITRKEFYFEYDIPATDNCIIPQNRRIAWNPGVPGDTLPEYPIGIDVKNPPYNAAGDGITDDTLAIKSAIADCPVGSAVYFPAGTYRITDVLSIYKGIALRGAGPGSTRIILDNQTANIIQLGSWWPGKAINIISGYEKGSTIIRVADASTIKAGDFIILYQNNLSGLVSIDGLGGNQCTWCGVEACTWCGDPPNNGQHAMSQIVEVTSKTGNTLTLNRPVYFSFSYRNDPEIVKIDMTSGIGIEDLSLEMAAAGTAARCHIKAEDIAYSWIKNVHSYRCVSAHIRMVYSYGCEIRDCYLFDAYTHEGSRSYGLDMLGPNSDHLIENNKIMRCTPAVCFEGGGSGNVVAYNYMREGYYESSPGWFFPNIVLHGAHPYMNLFEGNVVDGITADNFHGSSSHNTFVRNYVTRNATYPLPATDGIRAVNVVEDNYYFSFLGNVFCEPGAGGTVETGSCDASLVIWRIGCHAPATNDGVLDPHVAASLFRHGNFNYITNSTQWNPGIPERNIPASFYLASKPAFFGSLSWPPIGPDIAGKTNKIPAQDITD